MMYFLLAITFICVITCCDGANILAMFPLPLFSHTNGIMPVVRELARRGHNVTLYSPFKEKLPINNLNQILVDCKISDTVEEAVDALHKANKYRHYLIRWEFGVNTIDECLKDPFLQNLIHDKDSKFDLIIAESLYLEEPLAAFGYKFNASVISYLPVGLTAWASYITGNLYPYSYVPCLDLEASDHMNLFDRLENTLLNLIEVFGALYYYLPKQDAIMRKYFNTPEFDNLPSLYDLLRNSPLTLVNSHYSVGYQRPYHKNVIEIGGVSIKEARPLPTELKNFMDEAEHGVIYLSFGSFFPTVNLNSNSLQGLILALGSVKQKVLLKWENETLIGKPENIKISSWFPQLSILAHPKCVLFITHGGLQGLTEAVHYGVPIVGIPLKGDQEFNIKVAETVGIGVKVNKDDLTRETILNAINIVLDSPIFKENVLKQSRILHDRPLNVIDDTIFWIEYVLRHNGAKHLLPATIDLHWYQYLLLDVIFILVIIVTVISLVFFKVLNILLKLFKKNNQELKTKID